ncbi:MAG TPA: protein-L-isoaspartate(D-aspartate) O-methyltransferase [Candidatus Marinimicrobia bacterium]|jgi:protein-L-isoaspartate(D-aspartate) O-methyltransferase|nr:protein-L-isoaspartate(D-aspartate) O-methyltransferase [Candidatus Neomarinimicrobiota bacterium]HQE95576.1 protein-L-isoaspartate(D-aspartate) O-methyltransferase [Candidatus Neomarinimicrobiota bacterium]HQH56354.1 protein-L-isoaspartate(D-aspartate) O-methyltransferase [Candidatus Neomarinimicrobiota bacterium]HQK11794.1 protein-L-isoaspartate(D-aspartate) O-methyltransferase [Candidatus Neomarinimicrobiota bacterium]
MGSRIKTLLFLLSLLVILAMAKNPQDPDYYQLRQKMVNEQIIARGVRAESVIKAMQKVERHLFVPEQYRNFAYSDRPLPIGEGQTISQPYIVALMTELLDLKKSDKVLEIGTGSGYQAAILAEICDSVYTIEIISSLGKQAQALLRELGYYNIHCKIGDGYLGWPEHAPYDGIIVTCAPSKIPQPLKEQLAEGGRMVIPVGATYTQELVLVTKTKGKLIQKSVIPVRFVPMLRSPNGLD